MDSTIPPKPTGNTRFALFCQAAWEKLWGRSSKLIDSDTVKWSFGANGISASASASGGGGTSLIQCVITQLYGTPGTPVDYIGVTKFNLSTMSLSGDQFNCAKCYTTRQPETEAIDGQTITYSEYNSELLPDNSADNVRMAEFGDTNNEYQVASPRYLVYQDPLPDGTSIEQFLVQVSTLQNKVGTLDVDGNPIKYIEVNSNRRWAYSPNLNGGND